MREQFPLSIPFKHHASIAGATLACLSEKKKNELQKMSVDKIIPTLSPSKGRSKLDACALPQICKKNTNYDHLYLKIQSKSETKIYIKIHMLEQDFYKKRHLLIHKKDCLSLLDAWNDNSQPRNCRHQTKHLSINVLENVIY